MDVRPGYKQTEVGVIPDDWEPVLLSEFIDFQNGVNAEKRAYGTGFRFINVLEVITKSHLRTQDIPGRVELSKSQAANFAVRPGDIVFNRTSETQEEVGLPAVYIGEEPVVFGGFVIRGRQRDEQLHTIYAGYGLRAPLIRKQVVARGQGAIRANIGQADLKKVWVPLPAMAEQEAIAEALSDADALIESLKQLLVKKRHIKQGAMQELLTPKRRLPGFTGEWEVKAFGQVFDYHPTATNSRSDLGEDGDTYYVHYGDIHTRFHCHLDFRVEQPPRIERSKCRNAALLRNGDWVMADASEDFGGVGKSIEILGLEDDASAVAGLHTFLLREKRPTFAPYFKGHLGNLHALHEQFLRVATGMKVFGVSKTALRDLLVPIPPIPEQTAIAAVLSDMDAEIAALEAKLGKVRQIKKGMMQELLTGRTRLV